jgi:hypothetical protein
MSDEPLIPAERELIRLIRTLRFGAVEIQVHDGRIVQIERRERQRFDKPATPTP